MARRMRANAMSLSELLRAHAEFMLPPSQRMFGWGEMQLDRLFGDLGAGDRERPGMAAHPQWFFFGTVFLATNPDNDSVAIADGQQRAVTATMLYAAARDLETDAAERARLHAHIAAPGPDGRERYRMRLRDADAAFFQRWVQEPGAMLRPYAPGNDDDEAGEAEDMAGAPALSDSQSNLLTCRNVIVEKLRSFGPAGRHRFFEFLETSSELIIITASHIDSALAAYASTYKRGLRIAETDKLKTEIIGDAEIESRKSLAHHWDECEAVLGKDALEELFQLLVLNETGAAAQGDLQSALITAFRLPDNAEAFIAERLVAATAAYRHVLRPQDGVAAYLRNSLLDRGRVRRIQGHLVTLMRVTHIEWRAPAILALETWRADLAALETCLAGLDRLAAAHMIAGEDPHLACKRYAGLARAIGSGSREKVAAALAVDAGLKAKARNQLQAANFAQKPRFRLPVLLKANDIVADEVVFIDPADVSCEHILPQSVNKSNPAWYERFRSSNGRRYIGHVHRHKLGNMTILPHRLNRKAGSREYAFKRQILGDSGIALSSDAARQVDWSVEVIEARSQDLCRRLIAHWGL